MEYKVERQRDGWTAITEVVLQTAAERADGKEMILKFSTFKADRPRTLVSFARVMFVSEGPWGKSYEFAVFGDYDRRLGITPIKQATKKSVGEAHAAKLAEHYEFTLAEAKEFYANRKAAA